MLAPQFTHTAGSWFPINVPKPAVAELRSLSVNEMTTPRWQTAYVPIQNLLWPVTLKLVPSITPTLGKWELGAFVPKPVAAEPARAV